MAERGIKSPPLPSVPHNLQTPPLGARFPSKMEARAEQSQQPRLCGASSACCKHCQPPAPQLCPTAAPSPPPPAPNAAQAPQTLPTLPNAFPMGAKRPLRRPCERTQGLRCSGEPTWGYWGGAAPQLLLRAPPRRGLLSFEGFQGPLGPQEGRRAALRPMALHVSVAAVDLVKHPGEQNGGGVLMDSCLNEMKATQPGIAGEDWDAWRARR